MINSAINCIGIAKELEPFLEDLKKYALLYQGTHHGWNRSYSTIAPQEMNPIIQALECLIANKLYEGNDPLQILKQLLVVGTEWRHRVNRVCNELNNEPGLAQIMLDFQKKVEAINNPIIIYRSKHNQLSFKFGNSAACQGVQDCLTFPLAIWPEINNDTLFCSGTNKDLGTPLVGKFRNLCQIAEVNYLCGLTKSNFASFDMDNPDQLGILHPLKLGESVFLDMSGFEDRKCFLKALKKKDVDTLTDLISHNPELAESTGLDEFVFTEDSQDPIELEMKARKECFYHALARCEVDVALEAAATELGVFSNVLAMSQQQGPYAKRDRQIILNNLMGGGYVAASNLVNIGKIALASAPLKPASDLYRPTMALICLYALELNDQAILNKYSAIYCGFDKADFGIFNKASSIEDLVGLLLLELNEIGIHFNFYMEEPIKQKYSTLLANLAGEVAYGKNLFIQNVRKLKGDEKLTEDNLEHLLTQEEFHSIVSQAPILLYLASHNCFSIYVQPEVQPAVQAEAEQEEQPVAPLVPALVFSAIHSDGKDKKRKLEKIVENIDPNADNDADEEHTQKDLKKQKKK